ncbi:MAG: glycosyltransferase family 4 protein [Bacteroidia bacterium]|nr:glycosyltransferase family 4 protein [Bacteroidia bacterium]
MRILINVPDLNVIGGKANYYTALQTQFTQEVSYFTYGSRGKKEGKVGTMLRMLTDYLQFFQVIRKTKPDLVLLNPSLEFKGFFRDGIFFFIASLLPVKIVVFWRGWSPEFEKTATSKFWWFMKRTFMKADAKIVLAEEFVEKVRSWGFKKPVYQETTVVDMRLVEGLTETQVIKKVQDETEINLLFLARLERNKGIFEILESYKTLKPRYPHLTLSIAGTGGAYKEVESYIQSHKLRDIKMLGFVQDSSKKQAFHHADIYLFPSTHGEGMPNSLLEAMGCGLPVITTPNAGIKDFFEEGKMGLILEEVTASLLTRKIEQLLEDQSLRSKISTHNFQYAAGRFYASVVARRLENICGNVLSNPTEPISGTPAVPFRR